MGFRGREVLVWGCAMAVVVVVAVVDMVLSFGRRVW